MKAKEYSEQKSSSVLNQEASGDEKIDIYKFFLAILIYKIKDKNKSFL